MSHARGANPYRPPEAQESNTMQAKHLISIADLSRDDIMEIFTVADKLKDHWRRGEPTPHLAGKTLAMVFEKHSMRTRVSFEVAMTHLGGHSIFLSRQDIMLGKRESVADGARVMARYVDCVAVRTFGHALVEEFAKNSDVPVINALSDYLHPCQGLSDIYTIREHFGTLDGLSICFVGDGNNVARSLAYACAKLDIPYVCASPKGYELDPKFINYALSVGGQGAKIDVTTDAKAAVAMADVVYTDVWASMGQEVEAAQRRQIFRAYQVNEELMSVAPDRAVVMHCLPAHRDEEITPGVLDSPRSIVLDQAENRLHLQKGVLKLLVA